MSFFLQADNSYAKQSGSSLSTFSPSTSPSPSPPPTPHHHRHPNHNHLPHDHVTPAKTGTQCVATVAKRHTAKCWELKKDLKQEWLLN